MPRRVIRVSHSPDSDDAFMFWALAEEKLDTGDLRYLHELADIETLNRRALAGELEVSAVSIHAYAYLRDRYALLGCGASMGDGYGPRVVCRNAVPADQWPAVHRVAKLSGERTDAAADAVLKLLDSTDKFQRDLGVQAVVKAADAGLLNDAQFDRAVAAMANSGNPALRDRLVKAVAQSP
jgi:predicted solute-binding protein